jgi:hypothetical protein
MTRGKFYWADGHVDTRPVYDVDPKSPVLQVPGPDGRHHAFVATSTIEDGRQVFRERPQISHERRDSRSIPPGRGHV